MKRKIIKIDENLCNGCGNCIPNCPEGAIGIIDGKARLVSDLFCDGLGACLGHCPLGAITTEEREAEPYDEKIVIENIILQGKNVVKAHLKHLEDHNETKYLQDAKSVLKEKGMLVEIEQELKNEEKQMKEEKMACGCPGTMMRNKFDQHEQETNHQNHNISSNKSELKQWPVQLTLLNPNAPYFENADIVICADCVPFAYPNFHSRFLKNKVLAIFCPKLDSDIESYVEKLAMIFKTHNIKSITIVKMEVPCCGGAVAITEKALEKSGKNIIIKEYTISLDGEIM